MGSTARQFVGDDPHQRARDLVFAWLDADYEPDPDDEAWMSAKSLEALVERVKEVYAEQLWRRPGGAGKAEVIEIGTPAMVSMTHLGNADMRSPECPAYTRCLSYAAKLNWPGFTCRACKGPGTKKEQDDDE